MDVVALLSFCCCLIIAGSCFLKRANIFSPARVFLFVWCLAIGLAELKLSNFQHEWSVENWLTVLTGPAAFLCGTLFVASKNVGMRVLSPDKIRESWSGEMINTARLYRIIVMLFILFIVGYASIVLSGKQIPIFSNRSGEARLQFQMFGVGLFLHNVVFIVFFTAVYFLLEKGGTSRKFVLVALSLLSVALYALTLQRFQIMMAVILTLMFMYYTTRVLRLSRVIMFGCAIVAFFYLISTVRGGQFYIMYLYVTSQMKYSPQYAIFTEPYMYFAMNVENFAHAASRLTEFTYGFFTFDFIEALTGVKHWVSTYFSLVETPYLVSGYNTYSAFWTYYRDFGMIGLLIFPFAFGLLVSAMYYKMVRNPSIQTIAVYCLCIFTVLFSFFHNLVSFLWYEYNIAGMYLIFRLISFGPRPAGQTDRVPSL